MHLVNLKIKCQSTDLSKKNRRGKNNEKYNLAPNKNGKIMLSMRSEKKLVSKQEQEENRVKEVDAITNKQNSKQIFVLLFLHTSKNHLYNHEISLISQHMFSTKKLNYYLNTPKKQQQYACSKKLSLSSHILISPQKKRERLTLLFLLFNFFSFSI